jgi:hypothetical protein
MGLDQYLFAEEPPDTNDTELYYFRKHPDLEGFMADLYYSKGGTGTFNCERLPLTTQDLDKLEQALQNNALPETTGFFFGTTTTDQLDATWDFIRAARIALDYKGQKIYYTSWW